jgi:acyl carrier protein
MTDPAAAAVDKRREEDVRTLIRQIVRELAPNPEGSPKEDANLIEELEYHSLALLELAFTLEDEFDLPPIDEETARKIVTVRNVEDHVVDGLRERDRLLPD